MGRREAAIWAALTHLSMGWSIAAVSVDRGLAGGPSTSSAPRIHDTAAASPAIVAVTTAALPKRPSQA